MRTKCTCFCFFLLISLSIQNLQAQCSRSAYAVSGDSIIHGGCIINGDLTISGNGILEVDMTGTGADTFVVRGNILLQNNAQLLIHADSGSANKIFIVSNTFNSQRTITAQGNSKILLQNIEFRTQEGDLTNAGNIYMTCYSQDSSQMFVQNCFLDVSKSWLLHNLNNQAALVANNTRQLPTEIYIYDSTDVQILNNSNPGLWLNFDSVCTLNLPLQNGNNYNWEVGSGHAGVLTHWHLIVQNAVPGLGINVQPTAQLTVNGNGAPATGEIHVGMFFASHNDTLNNLHVGLQNGTIDNRVTFNNVQLGPIAWQLYLLYNETLHVKNSTINEIGVAGSGSQMFVDSSVLQLAVLAAVGANSGITVNNSSVWNQDILAANSSHIALNNCAITGSLLDASDAGSAITANNCCLYANPAGCTENTMVDIVTGVPNCNPFRPAGLPVTTGAGNVTVTGVCVTNVSEINQPEMQLIVFPNPASNIIHVLVDESYTHYATLKITNVMGQQVLSGLVNVADTVVNATGWQTGVYFVEVSNGYITHVKKVIVK